MRLTLVGKPFTAVRPRQAPRKRSSCVPARSTVVASSDINQRIREGDTERLLVQRQSNKAESGQPDISSLLAPYDRSCPADVCVVGCGPAGLALSGELARRGLRVCLVGPESKFTNNYGVWVDEFKDLGLEHLLDNVWDDSICYFLNEEKRVNRAYGRLSRDGVRGHLLEVCQAHGVTYVPAMVTAIDARPDSGECTLQLADPKHASEVVVQPVTARMVTLAGGAVSAKFLRFEDDAPSVAVQTAYGIEARVEGYEQAYDPSTMLFMDYRRTHSGMWADTGAIVTSTNEPNSVCHPNWDGNLGTDNEAPSFLYAMPLSNGNFFLEETCLVARKPLPFNTLKRRLYRRLQTMGIKVTQVCEQEWSYIPVGGPMPIEGQCVTAFGAAANLVHPATGYSIARTLKEAPALAESMAGILAKRLSVGESSALFWQALWPSEKRRQASFHVFGMELLESLDVASIHEFFQTFFALPDYYWRGFLASRLTSTELLTFAFLTFATCSNNMRLRLLQHLVANPAGLYMASAYSQEIRDALQTNSK